jgi:predicted phosphodiesterase
MRKKCLILLLLVLFSWISVAIEIVTFDIFATSDIHGNLCRENSGILSIAALLEKIGRGENSFLVDCGDVIQGGAINRLEKGKLIGEALKLLNYDLVVPGNHDFDFGVANMREVYSKMNAKILAANLKIDGIETLPCCILEKNKVKFGFIGLTDRSLQWKTLSPELSFSDSDEALLNAVKELRDAQADIIILLMHDGLYFRGGSVYDIAKKFPMIDIIIGGHTHKGEAGRMIRKSYYIQSPAYGTALSHIKLEFDLVSRKIKRISSQNHDLKELKAFVSDGKFQPVLAEWKKLQVKAGERIEIEQKGFKSNLDLQENLVLSKMKEFCPDGDIYINLLGSNAAKNYNVKNLNLYALHNIIYYEDSYFVFELGAGDFFILSDEVRKVSKKHNSRLLLVQEKSFDKNKKLKVVSTGYIFGGMGNPESKIRNLINNHHF